MIPKSGLDVANQTLPTGEEARPFLFGRGVILHFLRFVSRNSLGVLYDEKEIQETRRGRGSKPPREVGELHSLGGLHAQ